MNEIEQQKRSDIQILRAFALIFVVAYHLRIPGFKNGFLGVDIFFVISGFLMAQTYRAESVLSFYKKRIARLLPGYYFVLLATIVCVFLFTKSSDFIQTIEQARAAVFGFPNVYFWSQDSYFSSNNFNPLLHLWSLGVELQFYLIVPLVAYFARNKYIFGLLVLASSIACFVVLTISPKTSFFLLPFRLWEFMIGFGCYSLFKFRKLDKNQVKVVFTLILLLTFLFPANGFSVSVFLGHPGVLSLIVTFLTVLLLRSKIQIHESKLNNTLVLVGDASYSIYLIHFPVLAFFWYTPFMGTSLKTPNLGQGIVILILFVSIGTFQYLYVEQRFKKKFFNFSPHFFSITIVVLATFSLVGLKNEFYSQSQRLISAAYYDRDVYRCGKLFRIVHPKSQLCSISASSSEKKILLLGNSHADSIKKSFSNVAHKLGFEVFFWVQNDPLMGTTSNSNQIIDQTLRNGISQIYLHYSLDAVDMSRMKQFVTASIDKGLQINFIGPVPTWDVRVPEALWKSPEGLQVSQLQQSYESFAEANAVSLQGIDALVKKFNLNYLDSVRVFCEEKCEYISSAGKPFYWDEEHLTLTGSRILESAFQKMMKRAPQSSKLANPGKPR